MAIEPCEIRVPFCVCDGYPQEVLTDGRPTAQVKFLLAWEHRSTFCQDVLGRVTEEGGNRIIYRQHKYPYGFDGLYAKSATITPLGTIGHLLAQGETHLTNPEKLYERAQVDVSYEPVQFSSDPNNEVIATERFEGASEFLTVNNRKLYWGTGASKVLLDQTEAPSLIVRMMDWVYTLSKVKTFPTAILDLGGCVNDAEVVSHTLNKTFAAGTLLCGNPQISREYHTGAGTDYFTITLRFTYRPNGWNKFPRTDVLSDNKITWESITDGTNNVLFYPPVSFAPLWAI